MIRNLRITAILSILSLLGLFAAVPQPVQAQAGTAWEVLSVINAYRAANGLDPLIENQYLNIAAQNHVEWMAETGNYSHVGIGGSSSTDRALAAGYGEGASVRVTENWARGPGMTASDVVYESWATSSVHNSQMLTTTYNEFGAGVALDGDGMTVYVVNFGLVISDSAPTQPQEATKDTPLPSSTPVPLIQPVITATPNPDGSIIHVVQYGQSLWSIIDAYDIPMTDLLTMNSLTEEDVIYEGQQLLIVPASSEVEETPETIGTPQIPTATPSLAPSATQTPTFEPSPSLVNPTETTTPEQRVNFFKNIFSGDTLYVGIGLVAVSIFGIALLLYTSTRLK